MVNVCVCVVSPRKPAQPLRGSSTIVMSAAAKSAPPEWQWGPACRVDTLSSDPSSTRAQLLHLGPYRCSTVIEPTSTWQNKSPSVRRCLPRQVDHLGLEETPRRESYMHRSLQLPPCIRAKGPPLGKTQLKKCGHLPVAWSCPQRHPSAPQKVSLPANHGLLMGN